MTWIWEEVERWLMIDITATIAGGLKQAKAQRRQAAPFRRTARGWAAPAPEKGVGDRRSEDNLTSSLGMAAGRDPGRATRAGSVRRPQAVVREPEPYQVSASASAAASACLSQCRSGSAC